MKRKTKDVLWSVGGGIIGFATFAAIMLWLLGFVSVVVPIIIVSVIVGLLVADLIYVVINRKRFLIKLIESDYTEKD